MSEPIRNENSSTGITANEKNLEILIAKLIPTSQYFERSFEMMQGQIGDLKQDMNRRFEQVDKRFEQIDRQFERVNTKLDAILDRVDRRIDEGLREGRGLTIRLFSFAMVFAAISMAGLMGKMLGIF